VAQDDRGSEQHYESWERVKHRGGLGQGLEVPEGGMALRVLVRW
jgi:hypothetical protein